MSIEQSDNPWHYFMGREGNLHDYNRKKCQWHDEHKKKWSKCFGCESLNGLQFLRETKYRIRKKDMPK